MCIDSFCYNLLRANRNWGIYIAQYCAYASLSLVTEQILNGSTADRSTDDDNNVSGSVHPMCLSVYSLDKNNKNSITWVDLPVTDD